MTRLEQAKLFLDFYFAPWGAAKGEVWETISGDSPFDDFSATDIITKILMGNRNLSEANVRLMKIVTG